MSRLTVHLVWATKYRYHVLVGEVKPRWQELLVKVCKPDNMRKNRRLALSISDAGWGEFIRQLEYKATWYGRLVSKISLYFSSSQMCHDCGFKNPEVKNLAVRTWTCPNCGETHDRDENAALNIRREALVAAGVSDTLNAHGDCVKPASVGSGLRSENHATSVV